MNTMKTFLSRAWVLWTNKRKTRLSGLLALLPLLALPAVVRAQFSYTNSYGIWAYTNNNGTITVIGYTGSGGAVAIPDRIPDTADGLPVTGIGGGETVGWANLTNLTIGNSVTSIGPLAFDYCISLASVTIGTNVIGIGDAAFANCTNLTSVYFQGNAPSGDATVFAYDNNVTVYYSPGTAGWGSVFGGRPTVLSMPAVPHAASATAIVTNGFVVAVTLTSGGSGYTNTPTVRIIGGGGSGAQAVAVASNGVVTAVHILDTGSGYVDTPVMVIAPPFIAQPTMGIVSLTPPLPALGGSMAQLMQLGLGSLSPYDNYQLEFAPAAGGVWTNFAMPFIPTSAASTQDVIVTGTAGFFRVRYVP